MDGVGAEKSTEPNTLCWSSICKMRDSVLDENWLKVHASNPDFSLSSPGTKISYRSLYDLMNI